MPDSSIDALRRLAANHRWTWHGPTRELLDRLPGADPGLHPSAVVARLAADQAAAWLDEWSDEVDRLDAELAELVAGAPTPAIAYFSPEFGVAAEVPQYSGGLGILAGDHLKAASDLGVPVVGVGLLYRQGFFRQSIEHGRQVEHIETVDPPSVGAVDTGAIVEVTVGRHPVRARVWKQMVGAVPLLLLDTDVAGSSWVARRITDRLYSGDRRHRLHQEIVLGAGGVRALRAVGVDPEVFHLNEGHACFLLLELLAEQVERGLALDEAVAEVRSCTLFTTHTPVPAGIDRFDRELVETELDPWAARLGLPVDALLDWARLPSDGPGRPFNTAALAFHLCGRANGVSQLHASVSRRLFATLPRAASTQGLTNGVHARTWVIPGLQELYDRQLGSGWDQGDPSAWSRVGDVDPDAFRHARRAGRSALVELVADRTGVELDPERPLIGFARRFAPYKRAALILRDRAGLAATLAAGAQFVFAGKAHPADVDGKAVLAEIATFVQRPEAAGHIALLPDYDMTIAKVMYGGSDVWLNNPIRPREACGTSGEKAALNGVLNCSILDGWWADWYTDGIGWVIPTADDAATPSERDDAEAKAMHDLLVNDVLPRFADPGAWWAMTEAMLAHLGPLVTAGRMVSEYDERFYRPLRRQPR